jgi:hypothetical protein
VPPGTRVWSSETNATRLPSASGWPKLLHSVAKAPLSPTLTIWVTPVTRSLRYTRRVLKGTPATRLLAVESKTT